MSKTINNETKAIEILKNDPCVSLKEVERQTGLTPKQLYELITKNHIIRMTKKEYIRKFLTDHPYYTYSVIESLMHYGQGNVARLAKKYGLGRDPHEITKMMRNEIEDLFKNDKDFDRSLIKEKYGVSDDVIQKIIDVFEEKDRKANKVSHKERVLHLLKTTKLDYTNIANIIGCDLGYVSRLAKTYELQRDYSFAEALENNIRYYLTNNPELSYEEIRVKLNRCSIDKVSKIADSMNVSRLVVPEEETIIKDFSTNLNYAQISEKYGYNISTIEKIAMKCGNLERDSEKDKKVIEMLKASATCTYVEISNSLNYNYSLVKEVAEENGYCRTTIDYGGKNKQAIIDLLQNEEKLTYKEIGKKVNRSQHTVWRIAKENNLGHNKKDKEADI